MKTHNLLKTMMAISVTALMASGCSSSGNDSGTASPDAALPTQMKPEDPVVGLPEDPVVGLPEDPVVGLPEDPVVGLPEDPVVGLMPGPGLSPPNPKSILAVDDNSTIETLLASANNEFPVLSANLDRNLGNLNSAELSTEFLVKTIRTDESGAYVISYVLDGTEAEITVAKSDCRSNGSCDFEVDGRRFLFWSWTSNNSDPFVHQDYRFMDALGFETLLGDRDKRSWFVFGARTEALPTGSATYYREFRARSYKSADPRLSLRQHYAARMRLVANFDMSQLEGRIYRLWGSPPGQAQRTSWPTSSFTITDGRIVNGQFTATLTGMDSNPDASFDTSVRDFMGHIFGEFYGPNAEEVGGVVTATRNVVGTADDRVLIGYIGGRKVVPVAIDGTEAFMAGVDRDFVLPDRTTVSLAAEMPTAEYTKDGFRISYTIDGNRQTIDVRDQDFGVDRYNSYTRRVNSQLIDVWTETGSFTGSTEFDHMEINGWSSLNLVPPGTQDVNGPDDLTTGSIGYIVYGTRTTVDDMPTTGTATYSGRMRAREWPSDDAVLTGTEALLYGGRFTLDANFADDTVDGTVSNMQSRPESSWLNSAAGTGLTFEAQITGNGISGTNLTGTGDLGGYNSGSVNGAFYGPGAAEVGGVLESADTANNKLLHGWFGAKKQP